jgi:hypothetical protein
MTRDERIQVFVGVLMIALLMLYIGARLISNKDTCSIQLSEYGASSYVHGE